MSVEVRPPSTAMVDAVAVVSAACLVLVGVAPPTVEGTQASPALRTATMSLTAQTQPLPVQLFGEQISFNVELTLNWLRTGAALTRRLITVPGTLASELRSGVPLPSATAGALTALADVEFEAGRDLIGYAQDIADFQIHFLARALPMLPLLAAGAAAVTNVVQQLADVARRVVTAVQQFTHSVLHTQPAATAAVRPTKAAVSQRRVPVAVAPGTTTSAAPKHRRPNVPIDGATRDGTHIRATGTTHLNHRPTHGKPAHRH